MKAMFFEYSRELSERVDVENLVRFLFELPSNLIEKPSSPRCECKLYFSIFSENSEHFRQDSCIIFDVLNASSGVYCVKTSVLEWKSVSGTYYVNIWAF